MTSDSTVRDRVLYVMSAVFGVGAERLGPDVSAEGLEEWSSVAHLHLMLAIEDAFGVQLEVDEFASLLSLADIVRRLADGAGS